MYQVTAMYQDEEVGYGEGEVCEYAASECAESVPSYYPAEDVVLVCKSGIIEVRTSLDLFRAFA